MNKPTMRFDNAFLTKNKHVGMQFTNHGQTFTVYRDKKGELHLSEHATVTEKAIIASMYHKRLNQYMPKKAH